MKIAYLFGFPRLSFRGWFWTLYVISYFALVLLGVKWAFAKDADPDGFQYHERKVPHPCYQSEVIDCVEIVGQPGTPAYCDWASKVAVYSAWAREDGKKGVLLYPGRPLTANEKRHVDRWLRFGRETPAHSWEIYDQAFKFCRTLAGPPMQFSEE